MNIKLVAVDMDGTLLNSKKEMPEEFEEVCRRCEQGELSTRQAAEVLGVSHTTFYRRYRKIIDKTVSKGRRFGTSE